MSGEANLVRFVRSLLRGGRAARQGGLFVTETGEHSHCDKVLPLIAQGAMSGDPSECWANGLTAGWLRRALLDRNAFQAQHRVLAVASDGVKLNLKESPLQHLASGDEAFLERHHVEAGERVRSLTERAQLRSRVTMSYSAGQIVGGASGSSADISDLAVDARRAIAEINRVLPRDCAAVVLDVCGFLKGLQQVERERGWPRRSAKLVLRIGLDQLAQHYGFSPVAIGTGVRARAWMEDGLQAEPAVQPGGRTQ